MIFEQIFEKRSRRKVKKYFGEIASQWDSISREFYSPNVRQKILEKVRPEPGRIVADIGAGTGFISEGLINEAVSLIAIDLSNEMLDQMRLKFSAYHNIDYRMGESNQLPVKDGIVDYALANMYLHHVEDPARAIQEMHRIMAPDGRLILTDLESHDFEFLKKEQQDVWLGFEHSEIRDWLLAAGFQDVRVESIEEFCCSTSAKGEEPKLRIFMASGQKP